MAVTCKLEHPDGTPADPPTFRSLPGNVLDAGDTIPWPKVGGGAAAPPPITR